MKIASFSWNQKQFVDKDSAPEDSNSEGWKKVPQKNPNKTYQIDGHTYKAVAKMERHLPFFSIARIMNIGLGIICSAGTLGFAPLFSKHVRQLFNGRQVLRVLEDMRPKASEKIPDGPNDPKPLSPFSKAKAFSLSSESMSQLYRNAKTYPISDAMYERVVHSGGAANVVDGIKQRNPLAKCGVMICANSGLPCGKVGTDGYADQNTLNCTTQEESILANVLLTQFGSDKEMHKKFMDSSFKGVWGLIDGPVGTSTNTYQGIDFTQATETSAYNHAYVLNGCQLGITTESGGNKTLIPGRKNEVTLIFADSINANPAIGKPTGTMQRTLNKKAINDYAFFLECIKTKLRASLDAMVAQGVSHAIVGRLSCGIYAPDKWRAAVNADFNTILNDVLHEPVGPSGEIRRSYFMEVLVPEIPHK